jgi:L,D-peptidoglycan transpeptidase YkuD (ErfK/YbiS/YcfS/YnhG family)
VSDEICGLSSGGCVQRFEGGAVHWAPGNGAFATWGAIAAKWASYGWESGRLGYPVTDEICGLRNGGCVQRFQGGAVHWAPGNGAYATWAAIAASWASYGWESGRLGYPVTDEACGLRGGGCVQSFERGAIYWSPGGGAHPVWGAILANFASRAWEAGSLGYPISAESCGTSCVQEFQYGRLTWTANIGVRYNLRIEGYCEALNRGALRYPSSGPSRVSFAIADAYIEQRVNFTTCVNNGGSYQVEWNTSGYAGESGYARPGVATGPTINKYSPTGSFSVTEAFGLGNPGTSLSYIQLNQFSRWGGRLNANYNKYFESSADIFPDENMWYYATRPSHDYRQGVVINYNRPPDSPIVMNAGFAIFLHANRVPTWGCISLNESDVVRYQQGAVPGDRIVMGVDDDIFS